MSRDGLALKRASIDWRDPRWLAAILFVCLLNFWHPVGYVGGGADDDRYLAGALCWIADGPCLPVNHWEGRWPLVASLAASIDTFGLNRVAIAIPSVVASLICLLIIKNLGDRFDPRIGLASALVLAAVPAFAMQAFSATVEPFELAFVLAGALAISTGRPFAAGLAFAMAFQVRETSVAALLSAAFLLRNDVRGLILLGAGFTSILLVELVLYYVWTGDPFYRRMLSIRHIALPSSELASIPKGPPIFNAELIRSWNYDLHVHWLIDGFLNLLVSLKTGLLYALAPLLSVIYRDRLDQREKRAALFLILSAFFYSAVLIYVLAIDPKPRLMFVPIAALALAFSIVVVRAWNLVVFTTIASVAALIGLTIASQPRQTRYQRAAEQFEARFPGEIETAQPGYFGLSALRDLPPIGSGKPYLLLFKGNYCSMPSDEDPFDLTNLKVIGEARAHPLAVAIGNRWSLCLFRYMGPPPPIERRPRMGPGVRISNQTVVNRVR